MWVIKQEELPPNKHVVDVLHCKTNSCRALIEYCSQVFGALLLADGTVRDVEELEEYNSLRDKGKAARAHLSQFDFVAFLKRTLQISCVPLQGPDGNLVSIHHYVPGLGRCAR
jgi:hypothetical protein